MKTSSPRTGRKQHATIREVAEMAGVSQMTVSRVLNRRESVKESTREKVEEAIQALETAIRNQFPSVGRVFIEVQSRSGHQQSVAAEQRRLETDGG